MSPEFVSVLCLLVVSPAFSQETSSSKLPVLFQFSQPSHNVAVFRGADLRKAIAAGIVPGFGSLGKTQLNGGTAPTLVHAPATVSHLAHATTLTHPPVPLASQVVYRPPQPQVVYRPAPTQVIHRPAPAQVVYRPAPTQVIHRPATTQVVYKPAPAPVGVKPSPVVVKPATAPYQPYVDPYPAEEALYTYEYAVKDDYTSNDFGATEARDGPHTNGQYSVNLPDGRLQTVTYTVNGGEGYVADVQYAGEAQFPPVAAPTTIV